MPSSLRAPERAPATSLRQVRLPADARAAVEALTIDVETCERARLIVSELVANAICHGDGSADVDIWSQGGGVLLRVRDGGGAFDEPFAMIRPPAMTTRHGCGLWICSLESDDFVVRADAAGTEALALVLPR